MSSEETSSSEIHDDLRKESVSLSKAEKLRNTLNHSLNLSHFTEMNVDKEVIADLRKVISYRVKYVVRLNDYWIPPWDLNKPPPENFTVPSNLNYECSMIDGIFQVVANENEKFVYHSSFNEWYAAYKDLVSVVNHGTNRSFAHIQLRKMQHAYELYCLNPEVDAAEEIAESESSLDYSTFPVVDNHIHHSACMTQAHLLDFIKRKAKIEGDTVVLKAKDGTMLTLKEVLKQNGVTDPDSLDLESLGVHAFNCFQRFDLFNASFSPMSNEEYRTIFLKTKNEIDGRFLAELTQEVFEKYESNENEFWEPRISIYGRSRSEWGYLAKWVMNNKLHSKTCRWMIQIPRIYSVWKKIGLVKDYATIIDNFFGPLFEVTINPESDPELYKFLHYVVGFDSVDDESTMDLSLDKYPTPEEWTSGDNPPYLYWTYYWAANMNVLNDLRATHNLNTFAYRPHCGESGDVHHLSAAFLSANCINHGIQLENQIMLQYLYYLTQIPISVSPLSNNLLFQECTHNPFKKFYQRGLHVTLSTDDPLIMHMTDDPIGEEYAVAHHIWRLNARELTEIRRNSVRHSGFERSFKESKLGLEYEKYANTEISNFSQIRLDFRYTVLKKELQRSGVLDVVEALYFDAHHLDDDEYDRADREYKSCLLS